MLRNLLPPRELVLVVEPDTRRTFQRWFVVRAAPTNLHKVRLRRQV